LVSIAGAVTTLMQVPLAQQGGLCIDCVEPDAPASSSSSSQHGCRACWQQAPRAGAVALAKKRNTVIAESKRRIEAVHSRSALDWQPRRAVIGDATEFTTTAFAPSSVLPKAHVLHNTQYVRMEPARTDQAARFLLAQLAGWAPRMHIRAACGRAVSPSSSLSCSRH
jgi:hypothetical protein